MTTATKKALALLVAGTLAVAVGSARSARSERFAGFTGFSPPNVGTTGIGGGGVADGTTITGSGTQASPFAILSSWITSNVQHPVTGGGAACGGGTPVLQGFTQAGTPTCVAAGAGTVSNVTSTAFTVTNGASTPDIEPPAIAAVANKAITAISSGYVATFGYFLNAVSGSPCGANQAITGLAVSNNTLTVTCSGVVTSVASASGDITVTNGTSTADLATVFGSGHSQKAITGGNQTNQALIDVNSSTGAVTTAYFLNAAGLTSAPAASQFLSSAAASNNTLTLTYTTPKVNDYTGKVVDLVNSEFMTLCSNGGTIDQFLCRFSGTGAAAVTVADKARPGMIKFDLGTTTTGNSGIATGGTGSTQIELGGGAISCHFVVGLSAQSGASDEYSVALGLLNTDSTTTQSSGVGLLYDRGNVATGNNNSSNKQDWECFEADSTSRSYFVLDGIVVSDNSVTTVATAAAAQSLPNTNWHNFDLEINAAGTAADIYDGVTQVCHLSAHLPGAGHYTGVGIAGLKSAGTTGGIGIIVDAAWCRQTLTSARSP